MSDEPAQRAAVSRSRGGWVAILFAFLVTWEGVKQVAWHDPIDPPGVNTVCIGHIEDVEVGDTYTKVQCEAMLEKDIPRYVKPVQACVTNFDAQPTLRKVALVSLAYNIGTRGLCKSSVVRKLNAGDVQGACDAFLLFDRANGRYIQGLHNRRVAERKLCIKGE